jgi:hypothetical protein
MSSSGGAKGHRQEHPLPEDYNTSVGEMETNHILKSTLTVEIRQEKGDTKTCLRPGNLRPVVSDGLPMILFDNPEVRKTVLMTSECGQNYIRTKPGGVKEHTLTHHTFLEMYESGLLPWDTEMTVEDPVSGQKILNKEVDSTVCAGDTIMHNKRQQSDVLQSFSVTSTRGRREAYLLRSRKHGDASRYS